jgi:hypothetical protein
MFASLGLWSALNAGTLNDQINSVFGFFITTFLMASYGAVSFPKGFIAETVRGRIAKGPGYHYLGARHPLAQAMVWVEEHWHAVTTKVMPWLNSASPWAWPLRAVDELFAKIAAAFLAPFATLFLQEERLDSRLRVAMAAALEKTDARTAKANQILSALSAMDKDLNLRNLDSRLQYVQSLPGAGTGILKGTSRRRLMGALLRFISEGLPLHSLEMLPNLEKDEKIWMVPVRSGEDLEGFVPRLMAKAGTGIQVRFIAQSSDLEKRVQILIAGYSQARVLSAPDAFALSGFFHLETAHRALAQEVSLYESAAWRILIPIDLTPNYDGLDSRSPLSNAWVTFLNALLEGFTLPSQDLHNLDRIARAVLSSA